jgi:hypothetical protein
MDHVALGHREVFPLAVQFDLPLGRAFGEVRISDSLTSVSSALRDDA